MARPCRETGRFPIIGPVETTNLAATPASAPQMTQQVLTLKDGWQARLTPDALELVRAHPAESRRLPRAEALELVERVGLRFPHPFLVLHKPNRRAIKLSPDDARVIDRWLGDDFGPELRHQLRARMSSAIPFGVLYFINDRYDWTTWTFGGLLLAEGILFHLRPSYWLLLLDVTFWIALIARNAIGFLANSSVLSALFGVLSLVMFSVSLRTFRVLRAAHRARAPATAGAP
jgi:hypothetical protein